MAQPRSDRPLGRSLAAGFAGGTAVGTLYFVIEPVALYHGAIPYLGSPLTAILLVYAAFGGAVGVLAGAAAWRLPVRTWVATAALTGWVFTAIFIARLLTLDELAAGPVKEVAFAAVALVVWSVLGWMVGRTPSRGSGSGKGVWVAAVVAGLFLGVLAAWNPLFYFRFPGRGPVAEAAPNVVLIVVDALRSDHLSAYGYERDTSPNIKRLADGGVRFDRAYAHGNRTAISMPALFTSMHPSFNGAVGFQKEMIPLPEHRRTVSEVLRERGYRTVGMMSNIYLKTAFGLGQGFDRVEEFNNVRFRFSLYRLLVFMRLLEKPSYAQGVSPTGTEVTNAAIDWLHRLPKDGPFFMFVHYMDVHHAYRPPEAHEELFRSSPAVDAIDREVLFKKTKRLIAEAPPIDLEDDERQRLIDLYDACIHYTDSEVGRFVEALEAHGNGRETVVVLTADHGDEFMEHGSIYHVNLVHEELLRVPLVVWSSLGRFEERRVAGMARHVDVLPTIAELTGSTVPADAVGTSLVPLMSGSRDEVTRVAYAEGDFCKAVIYDDWKAMYVDTSDAYTLYHLADDPYGQVDVSAEHPEKLSELKALLDDYMNAASAVEQPERKAATRETIRQLRALGYVN